MKYNNLAMGFGIVFSLAMLPLAYVNLAIGLVLAFSGVGGFAIMIYVFAGLGVLSLIASCFARKNIWITRIMNTLSVAVLAATIVYIAIKGLMTANLLFAVIYVGVLIIGLLSAIFSWLAGKKQKENITNE